MLEVLSRLDWNLDGQRDSIVSMRAKMWVSVQSLCGPGGICGKI